MKRIFSAVCGLAHLIVALVSTRHLSREQIFSFPIRYIWQLIPEEYLKEYGLLNVLSLHSQPPGYNLLYLILVRIFGENAPLGLYYTHVLCGAIIIWAAIEIMLALRLNHILVWTSGIFIALYPALFLYETYPLYSTVTCTLITLIAYCFVRYQVTRNLQWVVAALIVSALLVLTRSFYHLGFLVCLYAAVLSVEKIPSRKQAAIFFLPLVLCASLFMKNYIYFGFVGSSSWYGFNFWHLAQTGIPDEKICELSRRKIIDPLVCRFRSMADAKDYLSTNTQNYSQIPILNSVTFHGEYMVGIFRRYGESAMNLCRYMPMHCLKNSMGALRLWMQPTSHFPFFHSQKEYLHFHFPIGNSTVEFYLILYILAASFLRALFSIFSNGLLETLKKFPAHSFIYFVLFYNLSASSFGEFGENMRFRFDVEMLMIVLFIFELGVIVQFLKNWGEIILQRRPVPPTHPSE